MTLLADFETEVCESAGTLEICLLLSTPIEVSSVEVEVQIESGTATGESIWPNQE